MYGVNSSVTMYLGDGGGSRRLDGWLMTGDGPGLDMLLSTSSWVGSGCGSWYSSIDEY